MLVSRSAEAVRAQGYAAWLVERKRQAERVPVLYLADTLEDLFRSDEVKPAETVVGGAEVAPG